MSAREKICGPARRRTAKKNTSGMRNAQQRGNKGTKSRDKICRPDFSSPLMVTGQVTWWCVGRKGRFKTFIFSVHNFSFTKRELAGKPALLRAGV
jgi:ribosomal protein L15